MADISPPTGPEASGSRPGGTASRPLRSSFGAIGVVALLALLASAVMPVTIAGSATSIGASSRRHTALSTSPVSGTSVGALRPLSSPGLRRISRATVAAKSQPQPEPEHVTSGGVSPAVSGGVSPHAVSREGADETSNWSGFIDGGAATFTGVGGQWVVPSVTSSGGDEYSGTWLGIDGATNDTLIQTGTGEQVVDGVASYSAWFELLPANAEIIEATVDPGDEMQAAIQETSLNVWTITIEDVTQSWEFSDPFDYVTPGASAEWIEEAPYIDDSQSTLADYNTVNFSELGIAGSNTADAVLEPVFMLNSSDVITSYPGPLDVAGDSFSVYYGEPAPVVTSVTPSQGTTSGGTGVTISGLGFGNANGVFFGTRPAAFQIVDDTTIFATAPADSAGAVDVTVTNPIGISLTSPDDQFTYVTPPPPPPPPPPPAPTPPPVSNGDLPAPVVGMAALPDGSGYWLADAQGGVSAHGNAVNYGSMAGQPLNAPISHIVATSDGKGYWLVAADGGTFAFGDAGFYGSMGGQRLNAPVVDIAPTKNDQGYWLVASDGGIFAFGDAGFHGSMGGQRLNKPVVGMSGDDTTGGYWEVATDGGIFAFNAPFDGSTGSLSLNEPVNGMTSTSNNEGYWFVASDGGIFAFGDAQFFGSTGGTPLNAPIVGMTADVATGGYWMVAADGGIFAFNAPFYGAD
jgi:hypothetical protein